MTKRPEISIIVPVYNVADYVAACIESIRAQTFTDFEAIVVIDGATDDSHARVLESIENDLRFTVLTQKNRGLSAARNAGLDRAQGRYIAFIDSDDRLAPQFLESLHDAINKTGAPWAACAIRSVFPDGTYHDHSALHSAPQPVEGPARVLPLTTWTKVVDHFPSAWNKLYTADLIRDLRFADGLLFEDHAFFQAAAKRTDRIAHLGQPLYLQTRARPGQITGADNDGVFDQIKVLDMLADGLDDSKPGGAHAYAVLASRLLFERAEVIRDPVRRVAFIRAAKDLLDRRKLRFLPDWSTGVGASLGSEIADQPPLSVVIPWNGLHAPLNQTLASLDRTDPCGMEVIVICDRAPVADAQGVANEFPRLQAAILASERVGACAARNTGLAAARGALVMFLDAGDTVDPWMPLRWTNEMLHQGAQVGIGPHRIGLGQDAGLHDGFHVSDGVPALPDRPELIDMPAERVLQIDPHPSPKIFSVAHLRRQRVEFTGDPLASWGFTLRALLSAERVLRFGKPGVAVDQAPQSRSIWLTPTMPSEMARALDLIEEGLTDLPPGWRHRLFARAIWEKMTHAPYSWLATKRFWWQAAREVAALPPLPKGARLDPYLDDHTRRLIESAGRGRLHCIVRALRR